MTSYPACLPLLFPTPTPPTSSGRHRPTWRGRQLLSGAKARGEHGNEAAQPALPSIPASLPLSGDRCDCLTRSSGGRVPIKSLGRPSQGPHGPSHLYGPPVLFFIFLAFSCIHDHRGALSPHYQDLGQRPSPWCGRCLQATVCVWKEYRGEKKGNAHTHIYMHLYVYIIHVYIKKICF